MSPPTSAGWASSRDALAGNAAQPGLMLDANETWNLKQAVRHVSAVEAEYDLAWIEEPLRRWDAPGHARLSSSIRAAVATGENLTGLEQYRPLLDAHAIDIVQAAATWGVTHFLRVAIAAHSRDLPVSPVGLTANIAVAHAAAAIPNHLSAEVQDLGSPFGVTTHASSRTAASCSATSRAPASTSTRRPSPATPISRTAGCRMRARTCVRRAPA